LLYIGRCRKMCEVASFKNFENSLTTAKVMAKTKVAPFYLGHGVVHRAHWGLWRLCAIQFYVLLTNFESSYEDVQVEWLSCTLQLMSLTDGRLTFHVISPLFHIFVICFFRDDFTMSSCLLPLLDSVYRCTFDTRWNCGMSLYRRGSYDAVRRRWRRPGSRLIQRR